MKHAKYTSLVILGIMLATVLKPCAAVAKETMRLSCGECVEIALENNRMCKISEFDIRIAEAMLKQAKSAYWPSLSAGLAAGIMDEPLVFSYEATRHIREGEKGTDRHVPIIALTANATKISPRPPSASAPSLRR